MRWKCHWVFQTCSLPATHYSGLPPGRHGIVPWPDGIYNLPSECGVYPRDPVGLGEGNLIKCLNHCGCLLSVSWKNKLSFDVCSSLYLPKVNPFTFLDEHHFSSALYFECIALSFWLLPGLVKWSFFCITVRQLLHQTTDCLSKSPYLSTFSVVLCKSPWTSWCPTVGNIRAVQHSQNTCSTWRKECKQSTHMGHAVDQMSCNNNPSTPLFLQCPL